MGPRPLLATVAAALLLTGASHEDSIDVTFPDDVAGLVGKGRNEFPQKELGVSISYEGEGPFRGSVYVYDGGVANIPSGAGSAVVRKHFAQVIGEVQQLAELGQVYGSLSPAVSVGSASLDPTYDGYAFTSSAIFAQRK